MTRLMPDQTGIPAVSHLHLCVLSTAARHQPLTCTDSVPAPLRSTPLQSRAAGGRAVPPPCLPGRRARRPPTEPVFTERAVSPHLRRRRPLPERTDDVTRATSRADVTGDPRPAGVTSAERRQAPHGPTRPTAARAWPGLARTGRHD